MAASKTLAVQQQAVQHSPFLQDNRHDPGVCGCRFWWAYHPRVPCHARHKRAGAHADDSSCNQLIGAFIQVPDVEELATVMRSVGQNPSPTELRELIGQGRAGQYTARDGKIDFALFRSLMVPRARALQVAAR